MGTDTLTKFCTYSLTVVNFIIWSIGCTLVGVGIWARAYRPDYFYYSGVSYLVAAPAIVITCGLVLFFLGIIGCVGIHRQIPGILICLGIVLSVLLILEFAAGVFAVDQRQWIYDTMETSLTDVVNKYEYDKGDWRHRDALDYLHRDLRCCGVHSPHDFVSGVPESCKVLWHVNPWEYGCLERIYWMVWERGGIIGSLAILLAIIQIYAIVMAFVLAHIVKDQNLMI